LPNQPLRPVSAATAQHTSHSRQLPSGKWQSHLTPCTSLQTQAHTHKHRHTHSPLCLTPSPVVTDKVHVQVERGRLGLAALELLHCALRQEEGRSTWCPRLRTGGGGEVVEAWQRGGNLRRGALPCLAPCPSHHRDTHLGAQRGTSGCQSKCSRCPSHRQTGAHLRAEGRARVERAAEEHER
jgi:hypothetical protein